MSIKKLDKLILGAFLGPFIITFLVVVFILLMRFLIMYFPDLVGKDLGVFVFAKLAFYFSMNMITVALPLAILLSCLITFGNLGEHFELTAIKGAGISLLRALQPIFITVCLLTIVAFYANNYIVPKANLFAWSLLYDIKHKKPSLDIKAGAFYNGIPDFSIKVNKKMPDGVSLKEIMIYDHTRRLGNTDLIIADSGKMYLINGDRYLMMELFNGKHYSLGDRNPKQRVKKADPFTRSTFKKSKFSFNLASFDLQETKKELFASNRLMKTLDQLEHDTDSIGRSLEEVYYNQWITTDRYYSYFLKGKMNIPAKYSSFVEADTVNQEAIKKMTQVPKDTIKNAVKLTESKLDSAALAEMKQKQHAKWERDQQVMQTAPTTKVLKQALGQARYAKNHLTTQLERIKHRRKEYNIHAIEKEKKYTMSVACIIMFLIGAPLGAIIKKGGLGVPVIVAIVFFLCYYVIMILGEKYAKENIINITLGVWTPIILMLPIGLFFLKQARNDARIFESDVYVIAWLKLKQFFVRRS